MPAIDEKMNRTENVKAQYKDDKNLSARIALHDQYSTNKQGFFHWLFKKYEFPIGGRILELGCGTGAQWQNRISKLPDDCILILSDFSDGMVNAVWDKYSNHHRLLAMKSDIQNIPFPDNCFDVIIANHMLYHVPDILKALSEVKRTLKIKGKFYTATNGNGGMRPFLRSAFQHVNLKTDAFTKDFSFSLQNGRELLCEYFGEVSRFDYEDSLAITETQHLIDWMKSTISISNLDKSSWDKLYEYFENIRVQDGAIHIPKELGLFISIKN